jgi:glycosyltransferase involved in cell wall biosynthesis
VIAGPGESGYVAGLKRKVADLTLESQVRLLGEVRDEAKESLFAASDVVIAPSYSENFGRVVAEALARGIPVIVSRRTPWRRVEERGCGLWIENDAASLSEAIMQISRMSLPELGERGRAWMIEEFSWDQRAQEMLSLYESVLKESQN